MLSTAPEARCVDSRQQSLAELGEIASRMAHEIRNPLNAIRMQVAVIRNKLARPDPDNLNVARGQLARLEQEILRVEKLTKAFLEFCRSPADEPEDVPLAELVEDVAALIRPECDERGIELIVQRGADTARLCVYADRSKLKQVFMNMLANARSAITAPGRVTLPVARYGDREVSVQVRDTGCGISSEVMPHIFAPFFSTRGDGEGLGLAIVKKIIEGAGGFLQVESRVGEGTSFRVILSAKAATD